MDIHENESVNKTKSDLSVENVQSLNKIPADLIDNIVLTPFVCKSEKEDYDEYSENQNESTNIENEINNIKSEEEAEASASEHRTSLDLLNNDDEEMRQLRAPEIQIDMDLESICSSSSNASFMKDLSSMNQTIIDGTNKVITFIAKCKLCNPIKEIRWNSNTPSNFGTHLKREHGDVIIDELSNNILSKKARLEENNNKITQSQGNEINGNEMKMKNGLSPLAATSRPRRATCLSPTVGIEESLSKQILFNTSVLNYFLRSFTPLSAVELPEFWDMFNYSDVGMPSISKKHLATQVEIKMKVIKNKIITQLEGVNFVCITTDMCSSMSHRFLAITCHWIDEVTFKRNSVVLACKRLDSSSQVLRSEKHLTQTLKKYNLPKHKIISNITKNFYNFSKLFIDLNITKTVKTDVINDDNSVPFQSMEFLPHLCYTKTLSLIATIDIPNLIDSRPTLRPIHESTMKKVFSFISLASSNATLAPMLADYKKPDVVKWNSIYDSIAYFLKLEQKHSLSELFDLVKIDPFTDAELLYLREYVKCFRPLALAFERLQCEQGSFQGFFFPTLLELRKKCEKLQENTDLIFCTPILKTILAKSFQRFEEFFTSGPNSDRVMIASVSHPFFKEKWLSAIDELRKETIRSIFIETVIKENSKPNDTETNVQEEDKSEQKIDDFYFGDEVQNPNKITTAMVSVELEVLKYLRDDRRHLKMLDDYPAVKRVFLKYNTSLSSSEAVEKIIPFETRQHIARYGCLAEELFEERVLLILNKHVLLS